METASLSKTVTRLSNEELGLIHRRVSEIIRRAEEGTIELPWVMASCSGSSKAGSWPK
jgi:hypothetical protein